MPTNVMVHRVEEIIYEKAYQQSFNCYTSTILIKTRDGNFSISLFSDKLDKLNIQITEII